MYKKLKVLFLFIILLSNISLWAQTKNLESEIFNARKNGDYEKAIDLTGKLISFKPANSYLKLIQASNFALNSQTDSSLSWLRKSILNGFTDYRTIDIDDDFESLRGLKEYEEFLNFAKEKALQEMYSKKVKIPEGKWTDLLLKDISGVPEIKMAFSFDSKALRIKAEVKDNHFKDGNRSWRYGDGFLINFVSYLDESTVYSDKFYCYGFSLENKKPAAVLVNKDGTYFLKHIKELEPTIDIDNENSKANYEIEVPWKYLYPVHPLLDQNFGVNIIYASQNDDGSRKILRYITDYSYDTESTNLRRFAPIEFSFSEKSKVQITGKLNERLVHNELLKTEIRIYSPVDINNHLRISLYQNGKKVKDLSNENVNLNFGVNTFQKSFELPETYEYYTIKAVLNDSLVWSDTFYKFDENIIAEFKDELNKYDKNEADPILVSSIEGISYRIEELEKSLNNYSDRENPKRIQNEIADINSLIYLLKKNNSIYVNEGYLLSGFESSVDQSLQPFSIYLPENFDQSKKYNLAVGLHGSGVNEIGFLKGSVHRLEGSNSIFIAPRGRDLSGWYMGNDELDVAGLVEKMKSIFNINKTLLFGFSMGGYGVWRVSFLHEDLFDFAICISGRPSPWNPRSDSDDMRNHIGKGKNIKYLVIHGTEDRAISIEQTDAFINALKVSGYNIKYVRVDGGGHGNFDVSTEVAKWLALLNNQSN